MAPERFSNQPKITQPEGEKELEIKLEYSNTIYTKLSFMETTFKNKSKFILYLILEINYLGLYHIYSISWPNCHHYQFQSNIWNNFCMIGNLHIYCIVYLLILKYHITIQCFSFSHKIKCKFTILASKMSVI